MRRYWRVTEVIRPEIAFCLWALCRDGLRAEPFDRHPAGNGRLRARGLEPDTWRRWLRAVVAAHERLDALVVNEWTPANLPALRSAGRAAADPVRFAPPKLRGELATWWRSYREEGQSWRARMRPGLLARVSRRQVQALGDRVEALGSLVIFLAPYLEEVAMLVPPRSVVLGVSSLDPDAVRIASQVLLECLERRTDGRTDPGNRASR